MSFTTQKFDYFSGVADAASFNSVWSMYDEVDSVNDKLPFNCKKVVYSEHWGTEKVEVDVEGDTWLDLWRAADVAIKRSGDQHHVFIENFNALGNGAWGLVTGS